MTANAGTAWVELYPPSRSLDDLVLPFQLYVRAFLAELGRRGTRVKVSATYRPRERAYLMHWAWKIARDGFAPDRVPPHDPPIPIVWSLEGAREMVAAYDLKYEPSLHSRHIERRAIDMTITGWKGSPEELHALGRSYGVIKLVADPPHWSDDGH